MMKSPEHRSEPETDAAETGYPFFLTARLYLYSVVGVPRRFSNPATKSVCKVRKDFDAKQRVAS